MTQSVTADIRAALQALDEIEAVFIGTRGFPEDVPQPICEELCGCEVCNENGCIFLKTAAARSALTALQRVPDGWQLVPKEPTPEMLAETLPNTGRHHDPLAERTAEQALFILENLKPSKYDIELDEHHKGRGAALDLIGDYRSMLAAAPTPSQVADERGEKS